MSDDGDTSLVITSSDFHILPEEVQKSLNSSQNSVRSDLDSPAPEKASLPKILQKVEEQDTPIFRKAITKFTSTISKKLETVSRKSKLSSKSSTTSEGSSRNSGKNKPVISTPQRRDSLTNVCSNQVLTPSYSQFDVESSPSSKHSSNEKISRHTPSSHNFWSIDQLAVIDPKDINETNGYVKTFQNVLSPNKERIHIDSIKNFFHTNHHIFQSPSPEKKSPRTALNSDSIQNQPFYLALLTPNAEHPSKSSSHSHPLSSSKKRSRCDDDDLISNDDTIHSSTLEHPQYQKIDPLEFYSLLKNKYRNQPLPEKFDYSWYDSLKTEHIFIHTQPHATSSPHATPKYKNANKSLESMDTSTSRRRKLFQGENSEDGEFSDVNCSFTSIDETTDSANLSKPKLGDVYKWQATPSGSPSKMEHSKSPKEVNSPNFLELGTDPFSSMSPVASECDSDIENVEPDDNLPRSSGCNLLSDLEFGISPILEKQAKNSVLSESNEVNYMPVTPASEMLNLMKLETPRDDSMANLTANPASGNTSQEQWFDARSQNSTSNSFLNNFSTSHNNLTSGYESNCNSKSMTGFPNRTNSLCNLKISLKADDIDTDPPDPKIAIY